MVDRFKLLLNQLQLSPAEFADRIGVQRSSISHILSGRNKPSIDFLEKILLVFPEIDISWLITGRITSSNDSVDRIIEAPVERVMTQNEIDFKDDHTKTPAPFAMEPVDQVIIVYKNNTFRILNPSE